MNGTQNLSMKITRKFKGYISAVLLTFLVSLLFSGCSDSPTSTPELSNKRSTIVSSSKTAFYTSETIESFAQSLIDIHFIARYDINVLKIEYNTINWNGDPVTASGVVFIPTTTDALPLMSLQHSTVFKRTAVASVNLLNSKEALAGIAFASTGYIILMPDYLGYGVSHEMHPYIQASGNANVVIDFIKAIRNYCLDNEINLNGQIFLGGYSEGGYITLATQRAIETDDESKILITAVAPCAGPYNLIGTVRELSQQVTYPEPAFLGFMLTAYNEIYGWNKLTDIFQSPYASQMPGLIDGTHGADDIDNVLPDSLSQLLNPAFLQSIQNDEDSEVMSAFQENTLLDWTPKAPIRFFHGETDQIVSIDNATTAMQNLRENGGENIDLISYPNLGHVEAAVLAYLDMFNWFGIFVQQAATIHNDHRPIYWPSVK